MGRTSALSEETQDGWDSRISGEDNIPLWGRLLGSLAPGDLVFVEIFCVLVRVAFR